MKAYYKRTFIFPSISRNTENMAKESILNRLKEVRFQFDIFNLKLLFIIFLSALSFFKYFEMEMNINL